MQRGIHVVKLIEIVMSKQMLADFKCIHICRVFGVMQCAVLPCGIHCHCIKFVIVL